MHVRASSVAGMPIVDDARQEMLGILGKPLIHPDSGKIEGFFVHPHGTGMVPAFLSASDIVAWGTQVHVREGDRIAPVADIVRLQPMLADPRTFLGEPIRVTETKRSLGRCVDVQFDTRRFVVEWLFPRRWYFMWDPVPASEILEVTSEAIWVREPLRALPGELGARASSPDGVVETTPATQAGCSRISHPRQ